MNNIDKILEKYWEGIASLTEEKTLQQYFSGGQIADRHQPFRPLFEWQKEGSNQLLGEDFEEALLAKLDSPAPNMTTRSNLFRHYWMQSAAAVLLLLGVGASWYWQQEKPAQLADVPHLIINGKVIFVENEQEAYQLTKEALRLVSSKMTRKPLHSINEIKKIDQINIIKKK